MSVWLSFDLPDVADADETQRFLVQAWHELLHPQTPDSFRARVLDLSLILDDLMHVADVAEEDSRWAKYLPALGEELDSVVDAEQRLLEVNSATWVAFQNVVSAAKGSKVKALRQQILIAKGLFGKPEDRFADDLLNLAGQGTKRKQAILARLSSIASQVCYRGGDQESLEAIAPELLQLNVDALLLRLLAPLRAVESEFVCTLAVAGNLDVLANVLTATEFAFQRRRVLVRQPKYTAWVEENTGCGFIRLLSKGKSMHAAAEAALIEVTQALNVYNLYSNTGAFRVRSRVAVASTRTEDFGILDISPRSHYGLLPRRNALELSVNRLDRIDGRLRGRLSNALECYAAALRADDPRTAIINFWTSLEAIAGFEDGGSIGDRVAKVISPIIAGRRMDKIVAYLRIGIQTALIARHRFVDTDQMPRSQFMTVSSDDVLEALCGPKDNPRILYLLAQCEGFPLLRNRLTGVWGDFNNPAQVAAQLKASQRRVTWQIQRIYRARNLLVHKGENSHLVWRLLDNAQYYVSSSLGRVLHSLSQHESWGIDECLAYEAMHLDFLTDRLKSSRPVTGSDILRERSTGPQTDLWGHLRKKPAAEAAVPAKPTAAEP